MSKTLANLLTYVYANGWDDQTSTGATNATNFINDTLQILSTLAPWPEYQHPYGKVVCDNNSAAITAFSGSGTVATITSTAHGFAVGDVVTISGAESTTFTVVAATNVFTVAKAIFANGAEVVVSSATTLPAPLEADTTYYVGDVSSATLKLYSDEARATVVDITDTGTGTHTIEFANSGDGWNKESVEITTVATANAFTFNTTYAGGDPGTGTATKDIDNTALADTYIWRLGGVYRSDRSSALDYIEMDEWTRQKRYHAMTGPPTMYTLHRFSDAAGLLRTKILVYPEPTVKTTLYYTWQSYPKLLSNTTDYTDWPDNRIWLLETALRIRQSQQDRDSSGAALYGTDFMALVNRAFRHSRPSNRPWVVETTDPGWSTPIGKIEKTFVD